jgi:hypothetical protein
MDAVIINKNDDDDDLSLPSLDIVRFVAVVAIVDSNGSSSSSISKQKTKIYKKANNDTDRCLVEDWNGTLLAILVA